MLNAYRFSLYWLTNIGPKLFVKLKQKNQNKLSMQLMGTSFIWNQFQGVSCSIVFYAIYFLLSMTLILQAIK